MTKQWIPVSNGTHHTDCEYILTVEDSRLYVPGGIANGVPIDLPAGLALCRLVEDDAPQPNWSKAPEWAVWWAINSNCVACWYENEPTLALVGWIANGMWLKDTMYLPVPIGVDWRTLKQKRPQLATERDDAKLE